MRSSAGSVITAASATSGTQAEEHPAPPERVSAMSPASAGPASAGTTHAVESTANIRGRTAAG